MDQKGFKIRKIYTIGKTKLAKYFLVKQYFAHNKVAELFS